MLTSQNIEDIELLIDRGILNMESLGIVARMFRTTDRIHMTMGQPQQERLERVEDLPKLRPNIHPKIQIKEVNAHGVSRIELKDLAEKHTDLEIADMFSVNRKTVYTWRKQFGIKRDKKKAAS